MAFPYRGMDVQIQNSVYQFPERRLVVIGPMCYPQVETLVVLFARSCTDSETLLGWSPDDQNLDDEYGFLFFHRVVGSLSTSLSLLAESGLDLDSSSFLLAMQICHCRKEESSFALVEC